MKKNKLIELLNALPGNPDIVLWNGMVGDWMDIGKLTPGALVKQTLEHYLEMNRLDKCQKLKNWEYQLSAEEIAELKECYKKFDWEQNSFVTQEDLKEKRYKGKIVMYIDARKRGVKTFDRLGGIEY